jgi:preprotein translocase subunit SecF
MSILTRRWLWFTIFLGLLVASIGALATWPLKVGIDFAGGTLVEYRYAQMTGVDAVRTTVATTPIKNATIQALDDQTVLIRTPVLTSDEQQQLSTALANVGGGEHRRIETVGPTIGRDLTRKAVTGVSIAILGILLYVAWAFRSVPRPLSSWQFGIAAVLTLAHDVLFVLGLFALLGQLADYTVDAYFITALLTVMGFSVHDTIVVFDRIRENMIRHHEWPLSDVFDASIAQTLVRSLSTSLTALIVLVSLVLLGGTSIQPFVVALIAGISVGTYSSIFVATPLLPVLARLGSRNQSEPSGE